MSTANGCRCVARTRSVWHLLALASLIGCQGSLVRRVESEPASKTASAPSVDAEQKRSAEQSPKLIASQADLKENDEKPATPVLPDLPATPRETPQNADTPLLDTAFVRADSSRRLLLDHLDRPGAKPVEPQGKDAEPAKPLADEVPVPTLEPAPVDQQKTPAIEPDQIAPRGETQADHPENPVEETASPSIVEIPKKEDSVKPVVLITEPSLEIGDLKICRRVRGFGEYDAIEQSPRAGSTIIVYCELSGLRFDEVDSRYQSRVLANLDLVAEGSDQAVWSKPLGEAVDHCRRPRRDYYVGYLVSLPRTVPAGSYLLRLREVDLLSQQHAERSIPVIIHR